MRGGTKVKKIFIIVMALMLYADAAQAAELTLNECIGAALANHPDLAGSAAQIDSARATIGQNAADGNLQASAGSSYTRGDSEYSDNSGSYSTGVSLSQSVYDWGKRGLKVNADTQLLEDVADLVFVEHYMLGFAGQKPDYSEEKWLEIIRKTWKKMSPTAREFVLAGKIALPEPLKPLIVKAVAGN